VREFPLLTGYADYLLFVDRKSIGAVEAKAEGLPLSGVDAQSEKYGSGLRKPLRDCGRRSWLSWHPTHSMTTCR
jgi:type I restriction enzyme, R subunit